MSKESSEVYCEKTDKPPNYENKWKRPRLKRSTTNTHVYLSDHWPTKVVSHDGWGIWWLSIYHVERLN